MTVLVKDWQYEKTTTTEKNAFAGSPAVEAKDGYWVEESHEVTTYGYEPVVADEKVQVSTEQEKKDAFTTGTTSMNGGSIRFATWDETRQLKALDDVLGKGVPQFPGATYFVAWDSLATAAEIEAASTPIIAEIIGYALQESAYEGIPLGQPLRLSNGSFYFTDQSYLAVWMDSNGIGICKFTGFTAANRPVKSVTYFNGSYI